MSKLQRSRDHTHPLLWAGAILCAIIAVVVIVIGVVLFVGYLTIKPKEPMIGVPRAQLNAVYFDQSNLLALQLIIVIRVENDNSHAHASFYKTRFLLSMGTEKIALLEVGTLKLNRNRSLELSYDSQLGPIPLNPEEAEGVNLSLKRGMMSFNLNGTMWSRWGFGFIKWPKSPLHLNCELRLPIDKTEVYPNCSSRIK